MNAQLFGNKSRFGAIAPSTPLDTLVDGIQQTLNGNGHQFATSAVARGAMSMESIDSTVSMELDRSVSELQIALEHVNTTVGNKNVTHAQRQAAVVAGIIASDIPGFLSAPIKRDVIASESMGFVSPQGSNDFFDTRMKAALEAYDEKENKNAVVYSVAYNMQAARQDEFGEAFFPTVVVTPDQVGFGVSIRLISVYNDVRRQISGNLDQFKKVNIIKAVIDPTILKNDQLKIVPVYRDESKAHFVDSVLLPPRDVLLEGETITTSALAMGKKFSLLAISQTEALLETGLQDTTDSIDTAVMLSGLYMRLGTGLGAEVVKFNTARLPLATFTYAVQGNYRQMNLAFETSSLMVNKNVKQVDGSVSTLLNDIITGEYTVRLAVNVSGNVNLELASTNVFSSEITVARVTDKDGVELSLSAGTGATIAALFADAAMVGYDLDAQRTNVGRRQRGQLLDTTFYNQVYAVPLRSPITVPRPLTVGDANDSSDLAALITATHIRTSNAAVEELLRVQDILAEFVNAKDGKNDTPEILGIARFLVTPFFEHETLDVETVIDSIKSHERAIDIQAVLVNKLRDMAYRMYRDSGYKAAADALAGGMSQVPTIIIGTDPVLSRYLTVTGDFRTLGNDFNVKVVSTLDERMSGRIMMTFGVFDGGMDGVPNPMHFGNMAWKPELTLVLPLHRNGANSKELTVQPSFLHITNLPIMASLVVEGISDVVSKKVTQNISTAP
jgi:hypothetical protein